MESNRISLLEEELDCIHLYLDDLSVPRSDDRGRTYSVVGRISRLNTIRLKEMSELESSAIPSSN